MLLAVLTDIFGCFIRKGSGWNLKPACKLLKLEKRCVHPGWLIIVHSNRPSRNQLYPNFDHLRLDTFFSLEDVWRQRPGNCSVSGQSCICRLTLRCFARNDLTVRSHDLLCTGGIHTLTNQAYQFYKLRDVDRRLLILSAISPHYVQS